MSQNFNDKREKPWEVAIQACDCGEMPYAFVDESEWVINCRGCGCSVRAERRTECVKIWNNKGEGA